MRERVTKKYLEELTQDLNRLYGRPEAYAGPERDANWRLKINVGHIKLDYAPLYGGYALREVCNEHGGEDFYWPSWERVTGREMHAYLWGAIDAKTRR